MLQPASESSATDRLAQIIVQVYPRLLGTLFLWTSIVKIRSPESIQAVFAFDGFPQSIITGSVWTIIAVELLLASLLGSFVFLKRTSLISAIALLSIYVIQLGYLLVMKDAPSCGCVDGVLEYEQAHRTNLLSLLRNICLIIPACWTLMQFRRPQAVAPTT